MARVRRGADQVEFAGPGRPRSAVLVEKAVEGFAAIQDPCEPDAAGYRPVPWPLGQCAMLSHRMGSPIEMSTVRVAAVAVASSALFWVVSAGRMPPVNC